jgi:hypothetical protein
VLARRGARQARVAEKRPEREQAFAGFVHGHLAADKA